MADAARSALRDAEARLEAEAHEAAATLAEQALRAFRDLGDARGVADAVRIFLRAERCRLQEGLGGTAGGRGAEPAGLAEVESLGRRELDNFCAAGDRYGEASVLCELAPLSLLRAEASPQAAEAAAQLARARTVFKDLNESALETQACLAEAACLVRQRSWHRAVAVARRALQVARSDPQLQGRGHQAVADCAMQCPELRSSAEALQELLEHAEQAIACFREAGNARLEAAQLHALASFYLGLGRPSDALPLARKAAERFEQLAYGKGWQGESRALVVKALAQLYRWRDARKAGLDSVAIFRKSGDLRSLILVISALVHVHLEAASSNRGDLTEASRLAEEAVSAARELGDRSWEANQVFNVAQLKARQGQWDAAERSLAEATGLDESLGLDLERAMKQYLLVMIHFEQQRFDKALKIAVEIRSAYQSRGRRTDEAAACLVAAQCHARLQDLQRAVDLAMEAKFLSEQEGDRQGEADAWELLGRLQRFAGQANEAEKAWGNARVLQQQAGDKHAQVDALLSVGSICAAQDRFEDTLKAAFEALALARASKDDKGEMKMLMMVSQAQLGILMQKAKQAQEQGDRDFSTSAATRRDVRQALKHAREAAVLARKHGDDYFTAAAIYASAQMLLAAGSPEAGIVAAKEAEELWAGVQNAGGAAYAVLLAAECHFAKPDVSRAEELANQALQTLQEVGEKDGAEKAREALARYRQGARRGPAVAPLASLAAPAIESVAEVKLVPTLDLEVAKQMARETALLAIGSEEDVEWDSPLMDMGLDSLSSIAFREQLISTSGLKVPSSLVFDYPTLISISQHLVELSSEQRRT